MPKWRVQDLNLVKGAAKHLSARHAYMLANSAGFTTDVLGDAAVHTTDNPR